jgi:hypothetical protein
VPPTRLKKQLSKIKTKFKLAKYLPIKGDGNCYFRAVMVGILFHCCGNDDYYRFVLNIINGYANKLSGTLEESCMGHTGGYSSSTPGNYHARLHYELPCPLHKLLDEVDILPLPDTYLSFLCLPASQTHVPGTCARNCIDGSRAQRL